MLRKMLFGVLFFCSPFFFISSTFAAGEHGTQQEAAAAALVKKAVAFLKANGAEKSFAAFSDSKGEFVKNELYIFVINRQGKMVAHGMLPKIIGKDVLEMKDADGKTLFKDMLAATATKENAWITYKWPNPSTKNIDDKATYLERVDDYVIGCGVYKNS
ncbi:cache domain-containing protein [Undibacterium sp. RuRC25W]|uniref:cache domain-containing protein n=1 Tax=Undibacterium sp. RuRC25W TaxID=3413047 RepID=UPI003BEF74DF